MTSCSRVDGVQQHACMASSGGARCCKQRRDGQGPVPVARTPLKTHLRSRVYSLVICTSGAQSNKDEIANWIDMEFVERPERPSYSDHLDARSSNLNIGQDTRAGKDLDARTSC